ncbi:ATP-dependent Clp protease ATP-binding subunit [Leptolyngbya cf. ectocarpi LEGE 11479]|uniref:ATP-dependent Clp protease ATP-binding subunit n=1 Tax=Leptolyngbya cf. ectocarpi LEGE 11479 TaxID=1828722 RepID=A0A929F627_LEPEC|nr:ATP-dependent Clp protease ATP-binding subunit [Leptolyngbya ectocarpi]MBE9067940.1 ATP-dependent Clp protease ATP-binding subunit [Leptolyngbya cf. ectocarpi LEGE 11479]
MFEHFTNAAIAVIMQAQEEARRLGHNFVGSEQLLLGIVKEGSSIAARVLSDFGVNLANSRAEVESIIGRGSGNGPTEIPFTPKVKQVFEQAFQEARKLDHPYIEPEHLLLSLTQNVESVAYRVLNNLGVDPNQVRTQLIRTIGEVSAIPAGGGRSQDAEKPGRSSKRSGVLAEFSTDLTELAATGKLDPVIGRAPEIERVVQILGRRTKNNPVLVGEPGVGKTAIAEGLAQRIVNQDVPEALFDRRVVSLDLAMLVSGTRFRGDFEERLNQVMSEVREAQNIILVIDEIHTLVGAGSLEGSMDAANLLKPALARGELQCIGATTLEEYRKHIEKDAALERRFQRVTVAPPSVQDTLEILGGLRGRYEQFHHLTITDDALEAAATLSDRYISDRHLPDKAIDLIDEAGSRVRLRYSQKIPAGEKRTELRKVQTEIMELLENQSFNQVSELRVKEQGLLAELLPSDMPQPEVTDEDIADIVAAWTGVPVSRLTESESAMILHLEDTLHERVVGQNEAVEAVSKAIRRSRVGMRNPNRPIASLIFSGPTGVGKTELAKALAAAVFGAEDAMIRVDMSEFMEPQSVAKLIGSPPGYVGYDEGGQLTEAVRRKPYTVILLDEIEKAHPDVFNILLQLLDDGHLSDSKGRKVSFKNTLIIMTSNIGSKVIEKGGGGLGFELGTDDAMTSRYNNIRNLVNEEMKQFFRPELLNRIDEIIVFRQLIKSEVAQIADILLTQVTGRLAERNISLQITDAFKQHLVDEGYDQAYGARPMRRAIARLVEDALAEALLMGTINDGDTAVFDLDDENQVVVKPAKQPALVGARA